MFNSIFKNDVQIFIKHQTYCIETVSEMKAICHGVIDFAVSINLFGILLFFSREIQNQNQNLKDYLFRKRS